MINLIRNIFKNVSKYFFNLVLFQGCILKYHGEFNSVLYHDTLQPTSIEVTKQCPSSIYECISNFDLLLSCVAAEYVNGKVVDVYIHKSIPESIQLREIRTVNRLDSMLYRLGTLNRLERYAKELEFKVSSRSISKIWKIYAGSTEEKKLKLLNAANIDFKNVPEYAKGKREFIEGCPQTECRPFTNDELEQIKDNFMSIPSTIESKAPIALYLMGIPGSGKTTIAEDILEIFNLPSISFFASLDMDNIRLSHADFRKYLQNYTDENGKQITYKELVSWFNKGSNAEHALYKGENSLVESCILNYRRNFILPVHTIASIEFMQFVSSNYGYESVLVDVHVSYDVALQRVEARARATGRYTSSAFLKDSLNDYKLLLPAATDFVTRIGGRMVTVDNTKDGYGGVPISLLKFLK